MYSFRTRGVCSIFLPRADSRTKSVIQTFSQGAVQKYEGGSLYHKWGVEKQSAPLAFETALGQSCWGKRHWVQNKFLHSSTIFYLSSRTSEKDQKTILIIFKAWVGVGVCPPLQSFLPWVEAYYLKFTQGVACLTREGAFALYAPSLYDPLFQSKLDIAL